MAVATPTAATMLAAVEDTEIPVVYDVREHGPDSQKCVLKKRQEQEEKRMAESMRGLRRSHRCTEVSSANIGEKVTVMGWVQRRRNLGSLIFIDLRDRSGLLQIVFDEPQVGRKIGFPTANLRVSDPDKLDRKSVV